MTTLDEALRALEKKYDDKADAYAHASKSCKTKSDKAYHEVKASAYREMADDVRALLSARQEVAPVESVWLFRLAGSDDRWEPFVSEAHRLSTMRAPLWDVREFFSSAHTSEARDAARLDWLEKHGCWQFAGPSESDIRGPAYRWFDYDTDGHDYSATLREAIDAAMRQEAGSRE